MNILFISLFRIQAVRQKQINSNFNLNLNFNLSQNKLFTPIIITINIKYKI